MLAPTSRLTFRVSDREFRFARPSSFGSTAAGSRYLEINDVSRHDPNPERNPTSSRENRDFQVPRLPVVSSLARASAAPDIHMQSDLRLTNFSSRISISRRGKRQPGGICWKLVGGCARGDTACFGDTKPSNDFESTRLVARIIQFEYVYTGPRRTSRARVHSLSRRRARNSRAHT